MDIIPFLGMLAGTMTTAAFIPQLIKVIKTRSTGDLSLVMLIVMYAGVFLWLIYGILKKDAPVIAANAASFLLVSMVLAYKMKYR